jgi:hypothetical protein
MRYVCPNDNANITPEACLKRQEAWDNAEKTPCNGSRCWHFVCDCLDSQRERLLWMYRMEMDRQAVERKAPPPAIEA